MTLSCFLIFGHIDVSLTHLPSVFYNQSSHRRNLLATNRVIYKLYITVQYIHLAKSLLLLNLYLILPFFNIFRSSIVYRQVRIHVWILILDILNKLVFISSIQGFRLQVSCNKMLSVSRAILPVFMKNILSLEDV